MMYKNIVEKLEIAVSIAVYLCVGKYAIDRVL